MHLTFLTSDGLEQSAVSLSAATRAKSINMDLERGNYCRPEESDEDSGAESEFLVVDENSPLLFDLNPPGSSRNYMGDDWGMKQNRPMMTFKIKRKKTQRLPFVIVLTAAGLAAMVVVGFVTMFQDKASLTALHKVDDSIRSENNVTEVLPNDIIITEPSKSKPNGRRNLNLTESQVPISNSIGIRINNRTDFSIV